MTGFPRTHTSGTPLALPALKAPMAPPVEAAPPTMASPPAMKMPKAPSPGKIKGATVTTKKPKPPSSRLREMNGM